MFIYNNIKKYSYKYYINNYMNIIFCIDRLKNISHNYY